MSLIIKSANHKKLVSTLKHLLVVCLLAITNSCYSSYDDRNFKFSGAASHEESRLSLYLNLPNSQESSAAEIPTHTTYYTPQDARNFQFPGTVSRGAGTHMYDIGQALPSQPYSAVTREPTSIEFLQSIHNIHNQLNRIRFKGMTFAGKRALVAEYNRFIDIVESTDVKYWGKNETMQLRCYRLSLLLGAANVSGALCDNEKQFTHALKAYKFLGLLSGDINNAYLDGRSLILVPTTSATVKILCRAAVFSSDLSMKIFLNNLIADNNVLSASEKLYFGDCLVNDFVPR